MYITGSEIALFANFETGPYGADQVYFYESNSQKIGEFGRARGKVFIIKKPIDLKNEYFLNFKLKIFRW